MYAHEKNIQTSLFFKYIIKKNLNIKQILNNSSMNYSLLEMIF